MAAHVQILEAAQRLTARGVKTFSPEDLVRELPLLNPQTVRTHVTSRCCVDAPAHHQSRLEYFRRVGRGEYELLPRHRKQRPGPPSRPQRPQPGGQSRRDSIHAVVTRDNGTYVVDCHEVAVVTQGRTLDEALANLVEAVGLHLEGEDLSALGLGAVKRIHVSYELAADPNAA